MNGKNVPVLYALCLAMLAVTVHVFLNVQEAFRAFHPNTKLVSKYMPGLRIGRIAPDEVVKDEVIKNDFIELRKTAEQMVCNHASFLLTFYFFYSLQASA